MVLSCHFDFDRDFNRGVIRTLKEGLMLVGSALRPRDNRGRHDLGGGPLVGGEPCQMTSPRPGQTSYANGLPTGCSNLKCNTIAMRIDSVSRQCPSILQAAQSSNCSTMTHNRSTSQMTSPGPSSDNLLLWWLQLLRPEEGIDRIRDGIG